MDASEDYLVKLKDFAKNAGKGFADENLRGIIDGVDKVTGILGEISENKKTPRALILPGAALLSKVVECCLGKQPTDGKSGSGVPATDKLVNAAIEGLPEFLKLAPPMLTNIQTISSVALGIGVLNLAVSVAGFVAIHQQLCKMDKKLDGILTKLDEIHIDIAEIKDAAEQTREVELEAAFKSLENVIGERSQKQIPRNLAEICLFNFQTLRSAYKRVNRTVWKNEKISIERAAKLYNSYLLSAIGNIHSLIMCDFSADSLEKTVKEILHELDDINGDIVSAVPASTVGVGRKVDFSGALRLQCERALAKSRRDGLGHFALFHGTLPTMQADVDGYAALVESSYRRIHGYISYPELAENIKIDTKDILRMSSKATGEGIYVLRPRGVATDFIRLFWGPA